MFILSELAAAGVIFTANPRLNVFICLWTLIGDLIHSVICMFLQKQLCWAVIRLQLLKAMSVIARARRRSGCENVISWLIAFGSNIQVALQLPLLKSSGAVLVGVQVRRLLSERFWYKQPSGGRLRDGLTQQKDTPAVHFTVSQKLLQYYCQVPQIWLSEATESIWRSVMAMLEQHLGILALLGFLGRHFYSLQSSLSQICSEQ